MISNLFTQPEITSTAAWQRLSELAAEIQITPIKTLFEQDSKRVQNFSLLWQEFFFDYSKNQITEEVRDALIQLALARSLPNAIQGLFEGAIFNTTEDRPSLHMALRQPQSSDNIMAEREKMRQIVEALNSKTWVGSTGKPITDIVNIGIGGSDLGPVFTTQALSHYKVSPISFHFISNIDPFPLEAVLKHLNPETTLFIVSSKTWSTLETLGNARAAKEWLVKNLGNEQSALQNHFIGITAAPQKALDFGIPASHILQFWDWVGGRYSIWSAIGLPLAISIGMENFLEFLSGAHEMDMHFKTAPLDQNLPALLALIGIWNINLLGADSHAILPYDYQLRALPDYLQQLDMESNGKSVQQNGKAVCVATGPIIWGQMGTNGQHAFYQLLHQGTHFIPVDFILTANRQTELPKHYDDLIANCLAQAQALMTGTAEELSSQIGPQEIMPGNRPSNLLMLQSLSPKTLGALIALYEHKVFVQGFIWNINSFDQPGVELGKKIAVGIADKLQGKIHLPGAIHSSTEYLLKQLALFRRQS